MNSWYIYNKVYQKKYGPYNDEQIKDFIQNKKIDNSCFVSKDGKNWHSFEQVKSQFIEIIPKKIAKFEIIRELGRGGMGIVYHARDTYLQHERGVQHLVRCTKHPP